MEIECIHAKRCIRTVRMNGFTRTRCSSPPSKQLDECGAPNRNGSLRVGAKAQEHDCVQNSSLHTGARKHRIRTSALRGRHPGVRHPRGGRGSGRGTRARDQSRYPPEMGGREAHPEILENLVLIGGRGCGKSSVAKRLARRNRNFILFSMDAMIQYESEGQPIPDIVASRGWRHFREVEFAVVERLSAFTSGALVDCGGGVVVDLDEDGEEVLSQRKIDLLRRHGRVVYLQRDPEYLMARIEADANRPALSDTRSFLELMERRDPWYRAAADRVLVCESLRKSEIADDILDWFLATQRGANPDASRSPGPRAR